MSEEGFSGMDDHFDLASTNLKIHGSSKSPHPKGVEDALDADGNLDERGYYIGGPGTPAECTYHLVSGTLNLNTFKVGRNTNDIIESISVTTSNGAWPEITVSGVIGVSPAPVGDAFTLPSITIDGKKKAQALGVTIAGADLMITGATLTAEGSIEHVLADADTIGGTAFSGSGVTATATYLAKGAAGSASTTLPDGVVTQAPATTGGITSWSEATAEAQGVLVKASS